MNSSNKINKLRERIEIVRIRKRLSKTELSEKIGVTPQKYSRILSGEYTGSFEEFEHFVNVLSDNESEKIYLATGKNLPQESTLTPDINTEMLKTIRELTATVCELKEEIRKMREDTSSAQVRIPPKVPEHH